MEKAENICQKKNVDLEYLYHKPLLNPADIVKELKE